MQLFFWQLVILRGGEGVCMSLTRIDQNGANIKVIYLVIKVEANEKEVDILLKLSGS